MYFPANRYKSIITSLPIEPHVLVQESLQVFTTTTFGALEANFHSVPGRFDILDLGPGNQINEVT